MYPTIKALLKNRIPEGTFTEEEHLLYQPKLDGIFFKYSPYNNVGWTKDEKEYVLSNIFINLPIICDRETIEYLFGELCYRDPITGKITRDRHKVMDVLRQNKRYKEYQPDIVFVIFDISLTERYAKTLSKDSTYQDVFLDFIKFNLFILGNKQIKFMDTIASPYSNMDSMENYFKQIYGDNLEGMVVRRINSVHPSCISVPRAVHPDWFKIKPVFDATLKCIGIKPHSKNPKLIGALILESSDKQLRVSVGSGLSLQLRYADKNSFIGKLIEIEFEDLIPKSKMLLHPRIKWIRKDMTIADSWEKLLNRI